MGVDAPTHAHVCVLEGAAGDLHSTGPHTRSSQPGEEKLLEGVLKKNSPKEWVSDFEPGQ